MKSARLFATLYTSFLMWLLLFPPWMESRWVVVSNNLGGSHFSAVPHSLGHHWKFSVPLHWQWSQGARQSFLVPNWGAQIDYRFMGYEAAIGLVAATLLLFLLAGLETKIRRITACAKVELIVIGTRVRNWHINDWISTGGLSPRKASISQDFASAYSKMSDDELLRIEADRGSLVDEAKQALEQEIQRRKITMPGDGPLEAENITEGSEDESLKAGSSTLGRLLVFLAFSAAGLTFVLVVFGRGLNGPPAAAFAKATTHMFIYSAVVGWGITQAISGPWLTIKRTIIIAAILYVVGIGLFATKLML